MKLTVKPGSDVHAFARFKKIVTPTEPTVAPTQKPTTPVQPQTGDTTNNILWLIISIVAFIAIVVMLIVYIRMKKNEKAGQRADGYEKN